jgi:hypothetical protein
MPGKRTPGSKFCLSAAAAWLACAVRRRAAARPAATSAGLVGPQPLRAGARALDYTPRHLAEKILSQK